MKLSQREENPSPEVLPGTVCEYKNCKQEADWVTVEHKRFCDKHKDQA